MWSWWRTVSCWSWTLRVAVTYEVLEALEWGHADIGGKAYRGKAWATDHTMLTRYELTMDSSEIAGDVVATIWALEDGRDVTIEITFRTKGMLSAMFSLRDQGRTRMRFPPAGRGPRCRSVRGNLTRRLRTGLAEPQDLGRVSPGRSSERKPQHRPERCRARGTWAATDTRLRSSPKPGSRQPCVRGERTHPGDGRGSDSAGPY